MAQTIVAQRGSASVTCDGTTAVTLFTQSSGIATRVILNSVTFRDSSTGNSPRMSLMINVNGSGNQTAVALVSVPTGISSSGITMFPGGNPMPHTNITANPQTYIDRWFIVNTEASINIGQNISNTRWNYAGPNGSTMTSGAGAFESVPSQFWMNSGDVLLARCFTGNSGTGTIVYSFTTITES